MGFALPTVRNILEQIAPDRNWSGSPPAEWADFIGWPPDVFALTSVILERAALFRYAASPPAGKEWPPRSDFHRDLEEIARQWHEWARIDPADRVGSCPARVATLCDEFAGILDTSLEDLSKAVTWRSVATVLALHGLADQSCVWLGIAPGAPGFEVEANYRLGTAGSLSLLSPSIVRVLPKFRTPQVGITPRSLSLHAATDASELEVRCLLAPWLCPEDAERFNLLLLPWPRRIQTRSFEPRERAGERHSTRSSGAGFFEFDPKEAFPLDLMCRTIRAAREEIGEVHGVVLPEGALAETDLDDVTAELSDLKVGMLLTGVRGKERNYARLAVDPPRGSWWTFDQDKHHRWCLDEQQIRNYHLGAALHPSRRWWEATDLKARDLNFVFANEWLTISHLICEDLARVGPAVDLIRSVGPTLVIALLLDGPQMEARWPGRYASVLADDPGSSVLTLTALGMAERSRPGGHPRSRKIALWKDQRTGAHELDLEPGADGLFLSLAVNWEKEFTADGRGDHGSAAQLVFGGAEPVRARAAGTPPRRPSPPDSKAQRGGSQSANPVHSGGSTGKASGAASGGASDEAAD